MAAYELKYTAEEIDGILESVDEKTIYDDATQSAHGLMSVEDKTKLDGLPDGEELSEALDSKIGKRVPTTAGNLAKLTGDGNIADSGYRIDDFATEQQGRLANTAYQKPSTGIPASDLASSVQTSLGKADTALQEHQDISGKQDTLVSGTNIKTVNGESLLGSGNIEIQGGGGGGEENVIEAITMNGASVPVTNKTAAITETDPTVPSWAKQPNKPSYNYSEIGNTPTIPVVPTNVSDFYNDAGYLTEHQDLSNYIQKSQTAGLLKNDGTVDTTQYGTYSKPSGGIPASDLASGVIPTVPVQDVTVGGTSVVNNGTAVIPQDVVIFSQSSPIEDIQEAIGNNKIVFVLDNSNVPAVYTGQNASYIFFNVFYAGYMASTLNYNKNTQRWQSRTINLENQADKVSTISGNETYTTKYPNTKATYDAIHPAYGSSQPQDGMLPNVLYKLGTLSGSVTIAFATPTDNTIENEYKFTFTADSTAPTITWPQSVTSWIGNSIDNGAPKVEAGTYYEVSVLDGCGIFNKF